MYLIYKYVMDRKINNSGISTEQGIISKEQY